MRLAEMQRIVSGARERLVVRFSKEVHSPQHRAMENSKGELIQALREVREVHALTSHADALLADPVLTRTGDPVVVSHEEATRFAQTVGKLRERADIVLAVIAPALSPKADLGVSVRLPQHRTFADLAATLADLQFVFEEATLAHYPGARVTVSGFDTGTMWINIAMDTPEAITLIATVLALASAYLFRRRDVRHRGERILREVPDADEREKARQILESSLPAYKKKLASRLSAGDASTQLTDEEAIDRLTRLLEGGGDVVLALERAPAQAKRSGEVARRILEELRRIEGLTPPEAGPPQLESSVHIDEEIEVLLVEPGDQKNVIEAEEET